MLAKFLSFTDRLFATPKDAPKPNRRDYAVFGGLTVFIFITLVLRRSDGLTNPQFWAEDGAVYFRDNLQLGFFGAIGHLYAGSPYLLQRLVALLASPFGVVNAPLIYNLAAYTIAALGLAFFSLPHFRHIVRNDYLRIFFGILCALLPESWEMVGILTNVHWYLAIWLALVSLMQLPRSVWGISLLAVCLVLTLFSCPQAIILAPVWGLRLGRGVLRRNVPEIVLASLMLAVTLICAILVVSGGSELVGNGSTLETAKPDKGSFNPLAIFNLTLGRIVTQAMRGGAGLAASIIRQEFIFATLLFLFVVGLLTWMALYKNLPLVLFGLYIMLASMFILLAGRPEWNLLGGKLPGIPLLAGSRYFVLGIAMVYFIIIVSLDRLPEDKLIKTGLTVFGVLFMLWAVGGTFLISPLSEQNWRPQATELQQLLDQNKPFVKTIPINPGWQITIEKK